MKLLEFEAKNLLGEYSIPIPENAVVYSVNDILPAIDKIGFPAVIKAQIQSGGRGKSGGVKIVKNKTEAEIEGEKILNSEFKDMKPSCLLIEGFVPHSEELYFSLTVVRPKRKIIALISKHGGVDIEEASKIGSVIIKEEIDPLLGLMDYQASNLANNIVNNKHKSNNLAALLLDFYNFFIKKDLQLLEINPLVEETNGGFKALDAKIIADGNSTFRQSFHKNLFETNSLITQGEKISKEKGFAYVPLDGDIAVIGNGAGLVMATLDLISYHGGNPACFIDVGGGASPETLSAAINIVINEIKPKALFINIFAGITRCDDVAIGFVNAIKNIKNSNMNIVIRLTGTNEAEGLEILAKNGFKDIYSDMENAAINVVKNVR